MDKIKPETITFNEVLKCVKNPLIAFNVDCKKGFLMRDSYNSPFYKAWSVKDLSQGNGWQTESANRLDHWFYWFGGNTKWYLFDTPQEMFAWLAE